MLYKQQLSKKEKEHSGLIYSNYYIDIFSGCGGLSEGLTKAGWKGLFAIEKNGDAFSTFQANHIDKNHFEWPEWLPKQALDINFVMKEYIKELSNLKGHVKLVAGGPPCQGFSMAGKRNQKDQRNRLVRSYIRFIDIVDPDIVVFENVFGFTVEFIDSKGSKKFSDYVETALKRRRFNVDYRMINMADFGVPQNRKRYILIGTKNGDPNAIFKDLTRVSVALKAAKGLADKTSVKEAISDLEYSNGHCNSPDSKGFQAGLYGKKTSSYQKLMRANINEKEGKAVDSHRFVNHSERIIELHKELLLKAERGKRIVPTDNVISDLKRRGVTVLGEELQAPTLTSIPDEIVHYSEPRILTVREYARLQSFPDDYVFKGKYTSGGKQRKKEVCRYTQIGNAIPPLFAEALGIALLNSQTQGERAK